VFAGEPEGGLAGKVMPSPLLSPAAGIGANLTPL
jgi:hypothetical protein